MIAIQPKFLRTTHLTMALSKNLFDFPMTNQNFPIKDRKPPPSCVKKFSSKCWKDLNQQLDFEKILLANDAIEDTSSKCQTLDILRNNTKYTISAGL